MYTDGSWKYPLRYYFSVGGSGVWWPNRDLKLRPLSSGEEELAHIRVDRDGVRLYTPIGGYSGSSTRTELAAGILAVLTNGPVHIGSDSKKSLMEGEAS